MRRPSDASVNAPPCSRGDLFTLITRNIDITAQKHDVDTSNRRSVCSKRKTIDVINGWAVCVSSS